MSTIEEDLALVKAATRKVTAIVRRQLKPMLDWMVRVWRNACKRVAWMIYDGQEVEDELANCKLVMELHRQMIVELNGELARVQRDQREESLTEENGYHRRGEQA